MEARASARSEFWAYAVSKLGLRLMHRVPQLWRKTCVTADGQDKPLNHVAAAVSHNRDLGAGILYVAVTQQTRQCRCEPHKSLTEYPGFLLSISSRSLLPTRDMGTG